MRQEGGDGVVVLLGHGDGTFPPQDDAPEWAEATPGLAIGDFNGDGKLDAAVGVTVRDDEGNHVGCRTAMKLGNGDGTFQTRAGISIDGAGCYYFASGDFNGDNELDLAAVEIETTLLLGLGDGTFRKAARYSGIGTPEPSSLTVGDFDGDGRSDLAIASKAGVQIILGRTVR